MIDKKRFIMASKIALLFACLIVTIYFTPIVFSKYETEVTTTADSNIAFYILKEEYNISQSMRVLNILPRSAPYAYNFTVSNFEGSNRLETDLEYDLKIVATTNLPLTYELYLNEDYANNNSTNIITSDTVTADGDGTFFKTLTTATKTFSFTTDETNNYTLVIYFPTTYISYLYQDIVENIEVIINSRQII